MVVLVYQFVRVILATTVMVGPSLARYAEAGERLRMQHRSRLS